MSAPRVSVVVETITAREDSSGSLAGDVRATLEALDGQSIPRQDIEVLVVIDDDVDAAELQRRYPGVKLVTSASNYFAAKNAGAAAASAAVVALLDGDCVPESDWLETLLASLTPGIDVVAGCTRYTGGSAVARTFSVPDFSYVGDRDAGGASGMNINNVAFRREVLLRHPFDERIRRNGGCYFLFHQLTAAGARIVYEPRAHVAHGLDIRGLGFIRKHFDRGYDGVGIYRLDESSVLRGTRLYRRLGGLALVPIVARRIVVDWVRLARRRRQIGISALALPYFAAVAVLTRLIELAGGLTASLRTQEG